MNQNDLRNSQQSQLNVPRESLDVVGEAFTEVKKMLLDGASRPRKALYVQAPPLEEPSIRVAESVSLAAISPYHSYSL